MAPKVEGSFQVTSWEEDTYEELDNDSKLTKVSIGQDYKGGLEASSSWQGQMFYREDGTAFYNGLQRFVGALEGRDGTFVADVEGNYNGGDATSEWTVVTGSGTADLAGLEGSGKAAAGSGGSGGTFTFDYTLG
jgi:Protein of unknown function (DUF3224)